MSMADRPSCTGYLMEDRSLVSGTERASVQPCSPSLSYLATESRFSPTSTWFTDARLNAVSCIPLPNLSGRVITGPLAPPHGTTDVPLTMKTQIVSSFDKFTAEGVGVSIPFQESGVLEPEPAPDSLGPHNTQHRYAGCVMPVSGSLQYEGACQPNVETASVDGFSPVGSAHEVQQVSLNALLSFDSCSSSERKSSKGMQRLIANMEALSTGGISSENSPSVAYPVQSLFPPRHAAHFDSENSVQMTSGKLDRHKQVGVSECLASEQVDGLSFPAIDGDIHMPQSGIAASVASCYDGNVLMVSNAPGTELSLAIASVVDIGTDQESEVSHATFGTGACALNNLGQASDKEMSVSRRDEIFFKLIQRVQELEVQLQERKEWAHQKAMQAACKFSRDMSELSSLRLEHEEILRLKMDTQALEDSTMKKLTEMESALRKAGAQVDRANYSVRKLEVENAELRAEMEAAKLSAAESNAIRQEVAKREKKSAKRVQAWEKQRAKLLAELSEEKQRITEAQDHLSEVLSQQHEAEVRWRQEEKAKDEAVLLADAEKWAKEQLEIAAKRKEEILRRKADANFQRYKDDVKRLESELGQFRIAAEAAQTCALRLSSGFVTNSKDTSDLQVLKDIYSRLLNELAELQESRGDGRRDHECVMCMSEESSVVFLPCAHQTVCSKCNDLHQKKGMSDCPSCRTLIQQRIHVFGTRTT